MVNSNDFLTIRKNCISNLICNTASTAPPKAEHKRFEIPSRNHEIEYFVWLALPLGTYGEEQRLG
jgi:hypothetical protein